MSPYKKCLYKSLEVVLVYYYTTHLGFQCLDTCLLPIDGERSTLISYVPNVQFFIMSFRLWDYYLTQRLIIEKSTQFRTFRNYFSFSDALYQ